MKLLRAAVVLGVSTPLVVLGCGSDDGSSSVKGAGGEGGDPSGASGAGGVGTAMGGEPSRGGSPSEEAGAPSGGGGIGAGQPSGGAGGAPDEPAPVCGDADLRGGLICFRDPQALSLVEGTPSDVAIGSWDATDGLDVVVAGTGLAYFSNDEGTFDEPTYLGDPGSVLGAGQLDSGSDWDLLLGVGATPPTVAFGGSDGAIRISQNVSVGYEGELYNFHVADVAGSASSQDFVVTHGYALNVVVTSGTEGEGFQASSDFVYLPNLRDGVLTTLGSAQWVVYSSQGDASSEGQLARRLVTYDAGSVAISEEPIVTPVGGSPAELDVGDFNEDGYSDVAATLTDSGEVRVLFGDGTAAGGFAVVAGTKPYLTLTIAASEPAKTQRDVKVGDFNGDGHADLAVSVHSLDAVAVFSGDGQGAFSEPKLLSTGAGSGPTRLAVGDLNDDGADDLAVVGETSSDVILLVSDP